MSIDDVNIGNVGSPMEYVKAKLLDWPEGGYTTKDKPYPRGEILLGGDPTTSGYFEMPEETEEAYKVEDGTRWFYTGDIGEVDPISGLTKIIDRKKDLSKLGNGEYISLGKVSTMYIINGFNNFNHFLFVRSSLACDLLVILKTFAFAPICTAINLLP